MNQKENKNKNAKEFWEAQHFIFTGTGGGCTAFIRMFHDESEIMITDSEASAPKATDQKHTVTEMNAIGKVTYSETFPNAEEALKGVRNRYRHQAEQIFHDDEYFYCEDCDTAVDAYKYDALEDTGHGDCKLKRLSPAETIEAMRDCLENGCLNEARI